MRNNNHVVQAKYKVHVIHNRIVIVTMHSSNNTVHYQFEANAEVIRSPIDLHSCQSPLHRASIINALECAM